MDVQGIVTRLLDEAKAAGSPERAEHDAETLRSSLTHYGMDVPAARSAAKRLLADFPAVRADPWPLVDACWATEVYDLRSVMSFYLERAALGAEAAAHVESILRRCHTWALVDQIAVQVVPRAKPDFATLSRWSRDEHMWLRRAALLADLKELRAGKGNPGRWANLAKPNFKDEDESIRKAIGWVLREIGKHRPDWTREFVAAHADHMSKLSVTEATRSLPQP